LVRNTHTAASSRSQLAKPYENPGTKPILDPPNRQFMVICFETFGISCGDLVEQVRRLRIGIRTIQKLKISEPDPLISAVPAEAVGGPLIMGKLLKYLVVAFFCNPRTVDLTCTFQEQLIVGKNLFLAARNKNSISQAAQIFFILLRAAQNNIGCFSHVTK
jgi:hypothetical protein